MTETTKEGPIKIFKMRVVYHTVETCDYEIYAPDLNCAHAIAATKFDKEHTDKCVRQHVEQRKPEADPNKYLCNERIKKSWLNL